MKTLIPLTLIAAGLVSACSETAAVAPAPAPGPAPGPTFQPQPASFTSNDVARFVDDAAEISDFEESGFNGDNNGTLTYTGGFLVEDMTVDGRSGFGLIGDSVVSIDLDTNAFTGTVSDVNFTEGGSPTELLGGSLSLQQGEFDSDENEVSANIAGALTGGFGQGSNGSVRFDMPMDGELLYQEDSSGDEEFGMVGEVTGGGTGTTTIQVISGTIHGTAD